MVKKGGRGQLGTHREGGGLKGEKPVKKFSGREIGEGGPVLDLNVNEFLRIKRE